MTDGFMLGKYNMVPDGSIFFDLRARYFKNTIVPEVKFSNDATGQWMSKEREYFVNNYSQYAELRDSAALFPDLAGLRALGLDSNQPVPTAIVPTLKMPYEADADGRVKTYTAPVTQEDFAKNQQQANQQLQALVASLTGGGTTTTPGTPTAPGSSTKRILTVLGIVVAAILAVVAFRKIGKK